MASPQPPDAESPPLPSTGFRNVVSYLIFIHFFFLLVSIKSKTVSSGLEQDLRERAPGLTPYVQLLGMDLSYMFHLTYYDPTLSEPANFRPSDTDFFVEADIPQPSGEVKKVRWPSLDVRPSSRYHRFERLVHTAAVEGEVDNETPASLIAQGIARRLMAENQCRSLTLHFRRRILQNLMLPEGSLELAAEKARGLDDPANFPAAYEANAYLTSDNKVEVAALKAASNTAAPRRPAASGSSSTGNTNAGQAIPGAVKP
ncbi:MAG: hypothetical protein K8U03_24540 [Planctomycetia bacterium]|nr:hypothetical protein [Planctomycetia bacterium]